MNRARELNKVGITVEWWSTLQGPGWFDEAAKQSYQGGTHAVLRILPSF